MAKETTRALESLADQGEKASEILADIEKEKAKRETGMKTLQDIVTGSEEDRSNIFKSFTGLQIAGQTGTLQGFDADTRKSVMGLLDQLGSVDDRFEQFKKQLVLSDALSMGLDPQIAQALANATPKEEQLQQQLMAVTAQETAATQALMMANRDNTTALSDSSLAIQNLITVLSQETQKRIESAAVEFEQKQKDAAAQKVLMAQTDQQRRGELNLIASAEKQREEENKRIAESNAVRDVEAMQYKEKQKALAEKETLEAARKKAAETSVVTTTAAREAETIISGGKWRAPTGYGGMAKGGIVYKAGGGSIDVLNLPNSGIDLSDAASGTDTVPAMLTPGEFVMKKSAVEKYGLGFMKSINDGTYIKRAKGGIVYAATGGLLDNLQEADLISAMEAKKAEMIKRDKEAKENALKGNFSTWKGAFDEQTRLTKERTQPKIIAKEKIATKPKIDNASLPGTTAMDIFNQTPEQMLTFGDALQSDEDSAKLTEMIKKLDEQRARQEEASQRKGKGYRMGSGNRQLTYQQQRARQNALMYRQQEMGGGAGIGFGMQGVNNVFGSMGMRTAAPQLSRQEMARQNYMTYRNQEMGIVPQQQRPFMDLT